MTEANKKKTGFTLLELLIVIAIIAILSVILIIVINPAETLKKSRDVQRMSDLGTLKTAIGLVLTSSSTPYLDGKASASTLCLDGDAGASIYYSSEIANPVCTNDPVEGNKANGTFIADSCTTTPSGAAAPDGSGWLPLVFTWLPGGSPISNLPLDPTNQDIGTSPSATTLTYRYICQTTGASGKPSNVFELGAVLESTAYTSDDNKMQKDGGDSSSYYEVGTELRLVTSTY